MKFSRDPFSILSLSRDHATLTDARTAYLQLARLYHPDRSHMSLESSGASVLNGASGTVNRGPSIEDVEGNLGTHQGGHDGHDQVEKKLRMFQEAKDAYDAVRRWIEVRNFVRERKMAFSKNGGGNGGENSIHRDYCGYEGDDSTCSPMSIKSDDAKIASGHCSMDSSSDERNNNLHAGLGRKEHFRGGGSTMEYPGSPPPPPSFQTVSSGKGTAVASVCAFPWSEENARDGMEANEKDRHGVENSKFIAAISAWNKSNNKRKREESPVPRKAMKLNCATLFPGMNLNAYNRNLGRCTSESGRRCEFGRDHRSKKTVDSGNDDDDQNVPEMPQAGDLNTNRTQATAKVGGDSSQYKSSGNTNINNNKGTAKDISSIDNGRSNGGYRNDIARALLPSEGNNDDRHPATTDYQSFQNFEFNKTNKNNTQQGESPNNNKKNNNNSKASISSTPEPISSPARIHRERLHQQQRNPIPRRVASQEQAADAGITRPTTTTRNDPLLPPGKLKPLVFALRCRASDLKNGAVKKVKLTDRRGQSRVIKVRVKPGWEPGACIVFHGSRRDLCFVIHV